MIVVFILTILILMSAPIFSRVGDSLSFETNKSDLMSLMDFAHGRAIMEGRRYGIQMDPLLKTYWLVREDPDNLNGDLIPVSERWGQTRRWTAKTEIRSNDNLVVFYPDGTATSLTLDLLSLDHPATTLRIDPVLGKAVVTEHG